MSPLILVLLSLLSSSLLLPSSAAEVRQSDDPTPVQERIALLPGGMTVSWSTVGPLTTDPSVVYGLSPDQLTGSASGWSSHYDPSLTTFHHVPLPGLTAATRYYWKVASPPTVNSSVLSFTTAPKVGSATPFSVAINGDMGYKAEAATLAVMKQWVQDGVVDWFYHIGSSTGTLKYCGSQRGGVATPLDGSIDLCTPPLHAHRYLALTPPLSPSPASSSSLPQVT
jgi:hypothetical protein